MKLEEFMRVIEEIGYILKLKPPVISETLQLYRQFNNSETHEFQQEIIICACIFLATKMHEEYRKIRDIINICYVVTKLYQNANKQYLEQEKELIQNQEENDKILYLSLDILDKNSELPLNEYIPTFSLEMVQVEFNQKNQYRKLKEKILQAEQHLLRILNYNFPIQSEIKFQYMLQYLKQFNLPFKQNQLAFGIYKDTFFLDLTKFCSKEIMLGSIYLAILLTKINTNNQQEFEESMKEINFDYLLQTSFWEKQFMINSEHINEFAIEMIKYYQQI